MTLEQAIEILNARDFYTHRMRSIPQPELSKWQVHKNQFGVRAAIRTLATNRDILAAVLVEFAAIAVAEKLLREWAAETLSAHHHEGMDCWTAVSQLDPSQTWVMGSRRPHKDGPMLAEESAPIFLTRDEAVAVAEKLERESS